MPIKINTKATKAIVVFVKEPQVTRFSDLDLSTYKNLQLVDAYPHLYGDRLPSGLAYVESITVDSTSIDWDGQIVKYHQISRAGGGQDRNQKYGEISQDIQNYGFKLRHPAIAVFRTPDGLLIPMNGRTRNEILDGLDMENLIVDVYEASPTLLNENGVYKSEVEESIIADARSKFGLIANAENDPSGDLTLEDVYRECSLAIEYGWISRNLDDIKDRVNEVCGTGMFTDWKRQTVALRIFNNYNPDETVVVWTFSAVENWLKRNKFLQIKPVYNAGSLKTRGIMYYPVASSTVAKGLFQVTKMASENPDYDIREIVHTGTLTGFDLPGNFEAKVESFKTTWDLRLLQLREIFFGGATIQKQRVVLYGIVPALSSKHNLEKLIRFKSDGTWSQSGKTWVVPEILAA